MTIFPDIRVLLVVAAHPDDEVLGCGATIALCAAAGVEVQILFLATGATSREPEEGDAAAIERLRHEGTAASAALGVGEDRLHFAGLPDQLLDTVPRLEVTRIVKSLVQECRPDVVLTHHPHDYNLDHRVVFDATLSATRPCAGEDYPGELHAFEVLSSSEWGWQTEHVFRPTLYVDVSEQLDAKRAALRCYASELRAAPHPRSLEGIDVLARKRGMEVGVHAAEAFETIRVVRRGDH